MLVYGNTRGLFFILILPIDYTKKIQVLRPEFSVRNNQIQLFNKLSASSKSETVLILNSLFATLSVKPR